MNPPTESSIDKVLRMIVEMEEISDMSEEKLKEIRMQSNKDLRNSI